MKITSNWADLYTTLTSIKAKPFWGFIAVVSMISLSDYPSVMAVSVGALFMIYIFAYLVASGIINRTIIRIKDSYVNFNHKWYHGCYQTGIRSKFTGDHVGRTERRCVNCEARQMRISQFGRERKEIIYKKLGKKDWYSYKKGDWLDEITLSWLRGEPTILMINKPGEGKSMLGNVELPSTGNSVNMWPL